MFETILVPLDGSELAESALEPALELKAKFGSHLVLVRAIQSETQLLTQPAGFLESPGAGVASVELMDKVMEQEREEAKTYLQAVQKRTGSDNVEALMIEEDAGDAIVRLAGEKNASLVVMSSHGRGGLGRAIFGSVADHVMHHCEVPMLLIRHIDKK